MKLVATEFNEMMKPIKREYNNDSWAKQPAEFEFKFMPYALIMPCNGQLT